jgi:hypothetical protein
MADKTIEVNIEGNAALLKKLRALGKAALPAARGSLYRSAESIMRVSKDQYVPIDTGNLKATGHVELPVAENNSVLVVMGYGGPAGCQPGVNKDVGYAVYVHEIQKNYRNGRQWKYLEVPLKAGVQDIEKNLKADIEEAFETLA